MIRVIVHVIAGVRIEAGKALFIMDLIADTAIVVSTQAMFIMAIERSWSMWTAVTYEDSRSAAFSLCLYLGLVAYAITLVVLWYLEVIDATLVFLISYIIMFLACILFAVLPSICRRAHKTVTQARRVTLAQR
ncbi:unnamed protein product, partial [Mesorhabditis spiculigera]